MVEAEGVTRFLTFAAATGAKAYVVHVSSREALDAAERFRGRVRDLRLETMIHYLLLDSSCTARPDFEGAKWILSPPLRTPDDQTALWTALADGRIDTLATDHCPFDFEGQKTLGRNDFSKIPNGIGGVEERIELALTHGVLTGKITPSRLVEVAAANPAKIFGIYPRKGTIAPGSDADIAIWDPAGERTIANATQHLGTDYNPYEGFLLRGHFRHVLLRGQTMVHDGTFAASEGQGRRV
jgi:dihydropyrimidinase